MAEARLYWSAFTTGRFLEMKTGEQDRVNGCVEMIGEFPFIGVRLMSATGEHRRRFVCGGYRIVYSITEDGDHVTNRPPVKNGSEEIPQFAGIIIRRFAPA
ncbi:MAG: type II toxin-antitoxin system RelE/ParE family toxin [Actinobacteria bacterium]|nr:type II toxin-antitoxin system RelE/ParE family toxin [Actinomycetota bacterium]